MSLARILTENTFSSPSLDTSMYDFSDTTCESYELDIAFENLISDIYTVDKMYMVADVIGEAQCIKEGSDPSTVLEGIVKGSFEKLKNIFLKFIAKIKSFFAAIKRQLLLIFKHGSDFVKEFKKELDDKKATGYEYSSVKYTLDAGNGVCDKIFKEIEKQISEIMGNLVKTENIRGGEGTFDNTDIVKTLSGKDVKSLNDFEDSFIRSLGVKGNPTDISELRSELEMIFRDGKSPSETSTYKDFEDCSKDQMIKFIQGFNKDIERITNYEKKFVEYCNKVINGLNKLEKGSGDEQEKAYKYASVASTAMSYILAVGKVPTSVQVEAYRSAASTYEKVLKGYLRFKPTKESAEPDGDELEDTEDVKEGYNLLDMAMRLI